MSRARYIMIGGFLGAGKSTAVARLASSLSDAGKRVGLITNDQGNGLVDTRNLRSRGFAVEEIPGGCFCCRFDSLLGAARKLTEDTRPDVFVAEPVGSCTDLVATVSYPLRPIYGAKFDISPFSVVMDPLRARRVFGLDEGRNFSDKVLYVYRKQLEEADFLVINKVDCLPADRIEELRAKLDETFPEKQIFCVSARRGDGLEEWFGAVLEGEPGDSAALEIVYDIYAEGEALLGWLNCTVEVSSAMEADGNAFLKDFADDLHARLDEANAEVAHLKMTLLPTASRDEEKGHLLLEDIALLSLVRQDFVAELSQELPAPLSSGQLVVNLRAEAEPEVLRGALQESLAGFSRESDWHLDLSHIECFRPGKPVPTHRFTDPFTDENSQTVDFKPSKS